MAGVAIVNAVLFGIYGAILHSQMDNPSDQPTLWQIFVAGSGSGLIQSGISSPMELIKIRLQNQGADLGTSTGSGGEKMKQSLSGANVKPQVRTFTGTSMAFQQQRHYNGPFDCIKDIWNKRGVRGLYRGMPATVFRETPSYGAYFASYEFLCRTLAPEGTDPKELAGWRLIVAGTFEK